MPRFLSRIPYGAKTSPVEEFDFEEDTEGADHSKYVWSNSAFAMAANVTRAFKLYGWCARIRGAESGGMIEGLPCHTFPTDDGGVDMKCPTEIAITDRREAELAKNGFMPLSHWKNTDYAVFVGAQSLQKPATYDDPDATANANLAARLPYLFATCRFAHYLKCMVRDKIGSGTMQEGNLDGMECDARGNIWTSGPGGVWVLNPKGERIGAIRTPEICGSVVFGGPDLTTLFLTTTTSVHKMETKVQGAPLPGPT